jgi:hypothetical protein
MLPRRKSAPTSAALHLSAPAQRPRPIRPSTSRPAQTSPVRIRPAKLQEVEDRLLADAIDNHPHLEQALDGALEDLAILSA